MKTLPHSLQDIEVVLLAEGKKVVAEPLRFRACTNADGTEPANLSIKKLILVCHYFCKQHIYSLNYKPNKKKEVQ